MYILMIATMHSTHGYAIPIVHMDLFTDVLLVWLKLFKQFNQWLTTLAL